MEQTISRELYIPFSDQKPSEAVAMWGGAKEDLEIILRTGTIPPVSAYKIDSLYAHRIQKNGLHLYYMTPVLENIRLYDGLLATNLINRYSNFEEAQEELSLTHRVLISKFYAENISIRRPFINIFGDRLTSFHSDTIVKLALDLLSELSEQEIKELKQQTEYEEETVDPLQLQMIKSCLDEADLKKLLKKTIKKKGVIFYCNSKLLDQDIRLGLESDDEILVTPNKMLTTDILIGAQAVTEFDMPNL